MSPNPAGRKRKRHKFALFASNGLSFEREAYDPAYVPDTLELAAGTGLFATRLAQQYPEQIFLAVDVKADRLQKGAQAAVASSLSNIRFLRMAADQLEEAVAGWSLSTLWLTFPDPFPKKRAAKHRLTHSKFLHLYARLLRPDGALLFKTDSSGLFTWSLEQLVASKWLIDELSFDLHASGLADDYKIPTTYEARFISEGLAIHFVRARPPAAAL